MKDKFKEINLVLLKGTSVKQRIIAGVVLLTVALEVLLLFFKIIKVK